MPLPTIEPPLLNSANPWATTLDDLQKLYDCPFTGAVTTRTSLINGFEHDDDVHQFTFFHSGDHSVGQARESQHHVTYGGSINTLGYSPLTLSHYLSMISKIEQESSLTRDLSHRKVFIVSVTGSADEVVECYRRIRAVQHEVKSPLCMEVNLSCPNIPGKPPPAYSRSSLAHYLSRISDEMTADGDLRIPVGIKTPPYTYHDQFASLIHAMLEMQPACPIDFISATNTLGSSLILADVGGAPAINSESGTGIGGLAGAPLHPLALGNVRTIRSMLDQHPQLKAIDVIGVGGVSNRAGFDRMRVVGAKFVAVGTALGMEGVGVFQKISQKD